MPVYVHCIYSRSISCRCSLILFSLLNCIHVFVWHNSAIRNHEYKFIYYNNYPVWRVLSVLAVLLWLLMHTSIFHAFWYPRQTQHFDLRLLSDRGTILIGRWPHLAMISSLGEVLVRMNIWEFFTPINNLKQLSQCEQFVSRTETPIESVENLNLVSQFRNTKAGGAGLIGLDSYSRQVLFIWTPFWFISVFESTAYLKFAKL